MRPAPAALFAVLALQLAGCAGDIPAARSSALGLAPALPSPWREDFGDPVLRTLLNRADLGNLDIKAALARLERAQADADLARSARAPRVQLGAAGALGGETFGRARVAASPTLEAVYDVDLWGGLRQGQAAARSEGMAGVADVRGARRLVAAQTVTAYLALRAAQDSRASAGRRSEILSRRLALVRARADNGTVGDEAVLQAETAVTEILAAGRDADDAALLQTRRLQALIGSPADLDLADGRLPPIPVGIGAALASDAVDARPDVQAALARLQAADARRAQAIAATRPQFQIVAALGAPDAAISTLLDVRALAWAVAGAVTHTILDGGAGRARVAQAGADGDQAELAWRKAVLDGWLDMQSAVTREAAAERAAAAATAHLEQSLKSLGVIERRHREGTADGVAMADARLAVEDAKLAVTLASALALTASVECRLAVGELT
ncbi:efflux transporter outer membrane subunit [soil metagenome]